MNCTVATLPKDIQLIIKSFLFPNFINETFDARIYPVHKRINYNQLIKEALYARRISSPILVYYRMQIDLPLNDIQAMNLVCELDIIDTLIFDPSIEYFLINGCKARANSGIYRPILSTSERNQWFFAPCRARLSDVIILPRPRAVIGGFINRHSNRTNFQMNDGYVRYNYESDGSCIVSAA